MSRCFPVRCHRDTVIWSNPVSASQIIPAVPSATGVADVFALSGGTVYHPTTVDAITSDGITAWSADITQAAGWILPDFRAGLVAMLGNTITTLNGLTGQPASVYTIPNPSSTDVWSVGLHTDGTIFAHLNTRGMSGEEVGVIRELVVFEAVFPLVEYCAVRRY